MLVVKLGGSLFESPGLVERIRAIAAWSRGRVWVVPGGGRFADEVRRLDQIHRWPETISHQLALQTMSLAAHMLCRMLPEAERVQHFSEATLPQPGIAVVDIAGMEQIETLPPSWELTSDSLAAWVAGQRNCPLLLAKSVDLPEPTPTHLQAAQAGLVDLRFPEYAAKIDTVFWVNLRRSDALPRIWSRKKPDAVAHFLELPGEIQDFSCPDPAAT